MVTLTLTPRFKYYYNINDNNLFKGLTITVDCHDYPIFNECFLFYDNILKGCLKILCSARKRKLNAIMKI